MNDRGLKEDSVYREEVTTRQRRFARTQRRTIGLGILSVVALVVILQLWLFTASMNAYLGGSFRVLLPAALGSVACLGLNLGLLWYVRTLDR
jgi:hypothetical protein